MASQFMQCTVGVGGCGGMKGEVTELGNVGRCIRQQVKRWRAMPHTCACHNIPPYVHLSPISQVKCASTFVDT